jgi:hypothetical protein
MYVQKIAAIQFALSIAAVCNAASAATFDFTCTITNVCPSIGECRETKDGDTLRLKGTLNSFVLTSPNVEVQLQKIDDGNATFDIYSSMLPNGSAILLSLHSYGFFITEHGLFGDEPDDSNLVIEYGPNFQTFYGDCALPQEGND